jgi:hypothetical protein
LLRIGRCRGGCASATVEENSTIAPSIHVVKWFSRAVDNRPQRFADARSRPSAARTRGRSNAERLDGAHANLTIDVDGPPTDAQIQRGLHA